MVVRGRALHARIDDGDAGHDAADQRVRRAVPVLQPRWPRPPGSPAATCCIRRWNLAPPTTRRCSRWYSIRSGMTSTTFDFAKALARQPRRAARPGHRRPHVSWRAWARTTRTPAPPRRRGLEQRQRHAALRADGARQGPAARRRALHRRGAAAGAPSSPQVALGNDAELRHGPEDRSHAGACLSCITAATCSASISDMLWLPGPRRRCGDPDQRRPGGVFVRSPFQRRLLEVLFDGKPEAVERPGARRRMKQDVAAERQRLVAVPADPARCGSWPRATAMPIWAASTSCATGRRPGSISAAGRAKSPRAGMTMAPCRSSRCRRVWTASSSLSPQGRQARRWFFATRSMSTCLPRRSKAALGSKIAWRERAKSPV